MENEVFVDVLGYEGLYKVSNLGNVLSVKRNKLLKLASNNCGYRQVVLNKDKKHKWFKVHRLVAEAFIPNPLNYKEVNHISEDKSDNRVENLEWCDRKYNCRYGTAQQRRIEKLLANPNWIASRKRVAEKCSKVILQFTKDGKLVNEYPSCIEASRQTRINLGSISQCCNGREHYKSAGGFVWKYKK